MSELERGFEDIRSNLPDERLRRDAVLHAATVAAIALFGDVDINEPLAYALHRMREKIAEMHPERKKFHTRDLEFFQIYCPVFILNCKKDAESQLEEIFCNEAPWLLKFTGVHWDALILGFQIPSLLSVPPLGRDARQDRNRWPATPGFTIDAGGACSDPEEPASIVVERLRVEYRLRGRRRAEAAERRRGKLESEDRDAIETYWGPFPYPFPPRTTSRKQ